MAGQIVFGVIFFLVFLTAEAVITKPSLGRFCFLGGLYDEKVDEIMGISLFRNRLNSTLDIHTEKTPYTETRVQKSFSFADKSRHVGLSTEDSISFLSGMTRVYLSGHYLDDHGETRSSVMATVIQNIKTEKQFIIFPQGNLLDSIDMQSLQSRATHVIIGKPYF
jgi:hypothetical protein